MAEGMLYLCRGETKAVEAVENQWDAWKRDHAEAMKVRDVEAWIPTCLQWRDAAIGRYQAVSHLAFTGDLRDFDGLGKAMLSFFDAVIALCEAVGEPIPGFMQRGYAVENAARLTEAVEEVRTVKETFTGFWVWSNPVAWERSRQEREAGRGRSAKEILHELRSRRSRVDSEQDNSTEVAS